jgi:sulfofructose kinase
VLDVDREADATDPFLSLPTHLIFSAESLRATTGEHELEKGLILIRSHLPASFLAVTDGQNEILWLEGMIVRRTPAFPAKTVDTLGAGDVFHGAFTLALAERGNEVDAVRFAAAAAAIKCSRFGGISGAPSHREVETLLTAGKISTLSATGKPDILR